MAKVVEGICDKNDLLGEYFTEKVDGLLDTTRELLNKALTKKQKEQVIEPASASLAEKTTYAAIAAKKLDHPRGSSHLRVTKEGRPPRRSRVSHGGCKPPL